MSRFFLTTAIDYANGDPHLGHALEKIGADAIFAANDVGAFGAIDALRFGLGLRVPEDVKVVGFDDIAQAHWKSYDLTTVRVDLALRVRALVRLILRRLKDPDAPPMEETVPTSLVVRGTVG